MINLTDLTTRGGSAVFVDLVSHMRLPWPKIGTGTLLCRLLYGRLVLLKKSSKIDSVRSKESEAMAAMKEAVAVELILNRLGREAVTAAAVVAG